MPTFFDDLATQRVRRLPRALRHNQNKIFSGTGHDDHDVVHHHLKKATDAKSTDEKRGHVFRALTQLNNRKRAETRAQKTAQQQAQPESAAGSPTNPVVEMY